MKQPYLLYVLLALLPAFAVGLVLSGNGPGSANAAVDPFRCTDSSLYFPASGEVGWTYQDPAGTDLDASGNRTVHTGVDLFAAEGNGAPIYAPADGAVSRSPGSESVNLILPGVANLANGELGIELYLTHLNHTLVIGQAFKAGDFLGIQAGDHVHLSVGAFIGYDDREIDQTQDPSPYFNAALSYNPDVQERQGAEYWCLTTEPATSTTQAGLAAPVQDTAGQVHVVQSGDTLSGIADTYGVSVEEIAEANDLSDLDFLSIGQELVIPGGTGGSIVPATTTPVSTTPDAGGEPERYLIEDGDSLYSIALEFDTDVETLMALNDLTDADFIRAGEYLLVP